MMSLMSCQPISSNNRSTAVAGSEGKPTIQPAAAASAPKKLKNKGRSAVKVIYCRALSVVCLISCQPVDLNKPDATTAEGEPTAHTPAAVPVHNIQKSKSLMVNYLFRTLAAI